MTRNAHAAAFAMSLVMTLSIFSSVAQLSVPSQAGAFTAQVQGKQLTLRG